jgi:hypothetical protein
MAPPTRVAPGTVVPGTADPATGLNVRVEPAVWVELVVALNVQTELAGSPEQAKLSVPLSVLVGMM